MSELRGANYLDQQAGTPQVRYHDGKVWLKDHSRTGDVRLQKPAWCLSFNGVDQLASSTVSNVSSFPFTLRAKVKWAGSGREALMSYCSAATTGHYFAVFVNNGNIEVTRRDGGADQQQIGTGSPVSTGVWYDLEVVFTSSTETKVYLDGSAIETLTYSTATTPDSNFTKVALGTFRLSNSSLYFEGNVSDFRFLDSEPTTQQRAEVAAMAPGSGESFGAYGDVLHLKLDDGSTTATRDSSGNDNSGTLSDAAMWTKDITLPFSFPNEVGFTDSSGLIVPRDESHPDNDVDGNPLQYKGQVPRDAALTGPCDDFNGVDSALSVAHPLAGYTGDWTMCCWVRLDASGNSPMFISSADAERVDLRSHASSRQLTSQSHSGLTVGGGGTFIDSEVMDLDVWYHVAVTFDSSTKTFRLYKNNSERDSEVGVGANINWGTTLQLGLRITSFPLDGNICNAMILKSRITDFDEIITTGRSSETVEAQWPLTEASGTRHDVSGNDHHLTPSNMGKDTQDVFDTLTTHGYRKSGSVLIPAKLDGSEAADGNPLTHQPGYLAPGGVADLTGCEPDSSYAGTLTVASYTQGGGSSPTAIYVRTTPSGDDRLIVNRAGTQSSIIESYTTVNPPDGVFFNLQTVTLNSSTGTTQSHDNDFGEMPKALFITHAQTTSNGVSEQDGAISVSFSDFDFDGTVGGFSEHNVGATDTTNFKTGSRLAVVHDGTQSSPPLAQATSDATAKGVELTWASSGAAADYLAGLLQIGGANVSTIRRNRSITLTVGNTEDITTVGFEPDVMIALSTVDVADNVNQQATNGVGIGFAHNGGNQASIAFRSRDVAATSSVQAYISDEWALSELTASSVRGLEATAWDSLGVDLTARGLDFSGLSELLLFLKLKDRDDASVQVLDLPGTTGQQTFNFGFRPRLVLLAFNGHSALNTRADVNAATTLSFITADKQACASMFDADGQGTSLAHRMFTEKAFKVPNFAGSTLWEADFVEFTDVGVKLDFTSVNAARKAIALALR